MAEEEVGLRITAEDEASRVIDDVADHLDQLDDGAEVEIEADTRDATRAIDRFADEVEGLTGDAREVRIEFKRQQLERDIRTILRDLERLEDPTEIEVRSGDLDTALADLNDLQQVASERFEIDLDVDPRRTAAAAVDDVENLRQRGEGLQSAIPAIRGFGDELGSTAAGAGIASQAVADLGDFALIAGERFATEGSKMAGVATRLGTVLGAAGLAGALAGIAVQLGQSVVPAIAGWIRGTDDAIAANEELAESARDVGEALNQQRYADAVRTLIDSNRELFDSAHLVEGGADALTRFLVGMSNNLELNGHIVGDVSGRWEQFAVDARFLREEINRSEEAIAAENVVIRDTATALLDAETRTDSAAVKLARYRDEVLDGTDATAAFGAASADAADDVDDLGEQVSATQRRIDIFRGKLNMRREFADLRDAGEAALGAILDHLADGETSADEATEAMDRYKLGILDALESLDGVPPQKVTEILALADQGSINEVDRALRILTLPRAVQITTNFRLGQGVDRDEGLLDRSAPPPPASTTVNLNLPASDGRSINREVARWARVNG